jgi:hypothetical protein
VIVTVLLLTIRTTPQPTTAAVWDPGHTRPRCVTVMCTRVCCSVLDGEVTTACCVMGNPDRLW